MTALRYSDPATFRSKLQQAQTSVQNLAAAYGTHGVNVPAMAERALLLGWNEDQIRDAIAGYVVPRAQHYGGQLAAIEQQFRNTAANNGVRVSDAQMTQWMRSIVKGDASTEQYESMIRDIAAQTFSAYGEQIKAGMDLKDIASPYMQSMGQILELNPASLDLFDPTIRKALSFQDDKGVNVPMSISAFEKSLRQDKRWQYTKNAKDSARGITQAIGAMWGLT
jgi:hypothetical protein